MKEPPLSSQSLPVIQDELLGLLNPNNIVKESYNFHLSKINSVASFVVSQSIKTILEKLQYDARKMVKGHFIDYDILENKPLDFDMMESKISVDDADKKIATYSPVISRCIENLMKITKWNSTIDILEAMSSMNTILAYQHYVSTEDLEVAVRFCYDLIMQAWAKTGTFIPILMADLADGGETLISRLMSMMDTEQIVLAKQGLDVEKVKRDYETSMSYVDEKIVQDVLYTAMLTDNERSFIISQAFNEADVKINIKRNDAHLVHGKVDDIYYILMNIINAMCPTGRPSKSRTSTSVCSEKISNSKMESFGIKCGPLKVKVEPSSGPKPENQSNVMDAMSVNEKFLTYDENKRSALITSPTLYIQSRNDQNEKYFDVEFNINVTKMFRKPRFLKEDQSYMFHHKFQYRSNTDYACIQIEQNTSSILGYEVYFQLGSNPNNDTFDYRIAFSKDNLTDGTTYKFCVPPDTFHSNGSVYVGIRPIQLPEFPSADIFGEYSFTGFSQNCLVWNASQWIDSKCEVIDTYQYLLYT
ncbi:hypothetical protein Ahia01_001370800 [Argonauta hians]